MLLLRCRHARALPLHPTLRAATRSTPHIYSSIFARHHHPHAHIDPTGPVRVRFAPSPTGNLHLGGLRTALFNYLLAKKAGGTFILRIEDTDRTRFVEGATEKLISALSWAGLDFQEGPGKDGGHPPYVQSQRIETYSQHAHHLLESGSAYRCFCTPERLQHVRDAAREAGRDSSYDRRCLLLSRQEVEENLSQGMPFTVRLLTPDGVTHVDDLVYGHVEFSNAVLDDTILIKSDGYPTYHMANVVDDHLMGITHVLRGEEWLSSTPRHILLYRAFDWTPPSFVHLPLLLNADRSKLSKRSGDVHVEDYVRRGYLPEALVNFVALLGWSPREDGKEVMRMEELVEEFSLSGLNKSNSMVSTDKLDWINKQHLAWRTDSAEGMRSLVEMLRPMIGERYGERLHDSGNNALLEDVYLVSVISTIKERIRNIADIPVLCGYFFVEPDYASAESLELRNKLGEDALKTILTPAMALLSAIPPTNFSAATVKDALHAFANDAGLKFNQVMMVTRYAVTGIKIGAGVAETMEVLGRETCLRRMEAVVGGTGM